MSSICHTCGSVLGFGHQGIATWTHPAPDAAPTAVPSPHTTHTLMTPQPPAPDAELLAALRNHTQCDYDGVLCMVSRQAVVEAADRLAALTASEAYTRNILRIAERDYQSRIAALTAELARMKQVAQMREETVVSCLSRAESTERKLAQAMRVVRKLAIHNVTANPGVLHHYKCLACDGRWSGRPTGPEQHNGDCPAALAEMDKEQG